MSNDSFFVSSDSFHGLLNDPSIIVARICSETSYCLVSHSKFFSAFWIDSLFKRCSTRDLFICNNYLSYLKPWTSCKNESECCFICSPFLSMFSRKNSAKITIGSIQNYRENKPLHQLYIILQHLPWQQPCWAFLARHAGLAIEQSIVFRNCHLFPILHPFPNRVWKSKNT